VSPGILELALLGGLLGLDGTSVGQFMVSRPLVAGALAGWVAGDPATGLLVGAVLELFLLVSFPTGGARFPEGSTATVVAVGTAVALGGHPAAPMAVALGLVWGQLGGATVTGLRHLNTHLAPEPGETVTPRRITAGHLGAIGLDFVRATLVTGAGLAAGIHVLAALPTRWMLETEASLALLTAGGAVSMGILVHDTGGLRARGAWFVAGLVIGGVGARLL
jgi:mannose/fructose/N-acetylgalactosamine-specific phosphotransferase system component IIC